MEPAAIVIPGGPDPDASSPAVPQGADEAGALDDVKFSASKVEEPEAEALQTGEPEAETLEVGEPEAEALFEAEPGSSIEEAAARVTREAVFGEEPVVDAETGAPSEELVGLADGPARSETSDRAGQGQRSGQGALPGSSSRGGPRPAMTQPPRTGNGRPPEPARPAPGPGRDRPACTAPQLKRFIKSRVYVPMHELRRRFMIEGSDDDVTAITVGAGQIYIGLPDREGRLLGELLRTGDVGYELSMDPPTPIVVGLYPMRPIPRS